MRRARVSARVRANRANAARSTGPRTPAGKARVAQNAVQFGLRAAASFFAGDERVDRLAALVTDDPARGDAAREVALAHLEAQLIQRLLATTWDIVAHRFPAHQRLADVDDDPAISAMLAPDERASIRGAAPVDPAELRLVARLERYARKLRQLQTKALTRRIRALHRYRGRALRRLGAAMAAIDQSASCASDGAPSRPKG